MSTRSVVALPHGDVWRGRYVHSDGYPTYMARTLTDMVRRDGLAKVITTLTESFHGWSSLSATQPDIEGVDPDKGAPYGTPAYTASLFSTDAEQYGYYADGRFANVPGHGVAYTDVPESDWHTPDPEAWTEWAYVLTPGGLLVVKQGYKGPDRVLGLYDWNTDHDWQAVEDAGYAETVTV